MQDVNQQLFSNTVIKVLEFLLGADASKQQAQDVLGKLGLSSVENRHPASLSGGRNDGLQPPLLFYLINESLFLMSQHLDQGH